MACKSADVEFPVAVEIGVAVVKGCILFPLLLFRDGIVATMNWLLHSPRLPY